MLFMLFSSAYFGCFLWVFFIGYIRVQLYFINEDVAGKQYMRGKGNPTDWLW